jgi:hypothetical protein
MISAPVSTLGQGIALIPLPHHPLIRGGWRADKALGLDRQARGWLGLRRALGVKRHAPRLAARQRGIFGLRLSQRSGRTRSSLSLAGWSRGRPWIRLASTPARRCRSRSPPCERLRKAPLETRIGMGGSIITLQVKSTIISLLVNTRLQRSDKQRKPSRPISRLGILPEHCALGLATTSLASALQVIWIPTRLAASSRLFVGIGRFRQPSVDLDQYPSDESDQAGKQHEHPSEGHEI